MVSAAERIVNLALFIASHREHVTAAECRAASLGYPDGQDDVAFGRMFERDKDTLRALGLVIEVRREGDAEAYRLDPAATFARTVDLEPAEIATLRAVAAALADDPGFPFGADLRIALGKLGAAGHGGPLATAELVEESPSVQGTYARALAEAVQTRKRITFGYTNARGEQKHHVVDPYGLFFREGRWYLAGLDHQAEDVHTYAVGRMRDLDVNPAAPRTPDFERPAAFDVRDHERLPFQYGESEALARIRFEPDVAWRAERLARGHGELQTLPDTSVVWTVDALDLKRLASWIIDEGPAIHAVSPNELIMELRDGMKRVIAAHE